MKTITLKLSGMSCQGCANTLKVALSRVSGVRRADVSFEDAHARLVLEDDVEAIDDLVSAARDAGYEASLATEE